MAAVPENTKGSKSDEHAYSLHNSDNPGMSLVTTPLDGRNYLSWSIAVKTALEAKDKIGFVDGSIDIPEDPAEYKKWKAVDSMIKSWIVNSISKTFSDTFVYCLTAKDLWNVLEERFGVSNAPQLYHVQRQTNSLRQGNDTITIYYNKLRRCWDELDRIMPMPTCTCGKCTCGLKKKVTDMMASIKLLQFLMGLSPVYDVVRTQILNLDPLPTVNKAFAMVVTDEAQREINMTYSGVAESSNAMMVKSSQGKNDPIGFKRKDQNKKDKFCDHCNMNGHTKETCFKIHGYPEWFKELGEKKGGKKQIANMATKDAATPEAPSCQEDDSAAKGDLSNVVSYILKEVQRLGKARNVPGKEDQVNFANLYEFAGNTLIRKPKNFTFNHWIIDTGATTHMCSNIALMHDVQTINYLKTVHLPDKSTKKIHSIGKEQKSRHNLAKGVAVENLYYLDLDSTLECNNVDCLKCNKMKPIECNATIDMNKRKGDSVELWHKRMGHPSIQVLRHVSVLDTSVSFDNACDICHKSKQHRLPFSISHTSCLRSSGGGHINSNLSNQQNAFSPLGMEITI
ncbi:uncharacterized protein G2W53_004515 [Senna tora]|uniref:Retrotransposon Copia-like N-terminal domain-containing protein n=1 Tax=Senna tora TaxID=362788 RepID=A0A834XCE9_9FABA|nr:uncharacterized protein G2W53_004515 [Senna tora]